MDVKYRVLLAAAAFLPACAGVPVLDRHSDMASREGYFLSGDDAQARGGVGNYAPRGCADAWGKPEDCPAPIAVTTWTDPATDGVLMVHFNTLSSRLSESDRQAIRDWARSYPNEGLGRHIQVWISGYADSRGPAGENLNLSQSRADAVSAEIKRYLPGAYIETVAEGEIPGTNQDPRATDARKVEVFGDVDDDED